MSFKDHKLALGRLADFGMSAASAERSESSAASRAGAWECLRPWPRLGNLVTLEPINVSCRGRGSVDDDDARSGVGGSPERGFLADASAPW